MLLWLEMDLRAILSLFLLIFMQKSAAGIILQEPIKCATLCDKSDQSYCDTR